MIQDQCNKCFKQGTDSCTENIVFDSTSCPSYGKKIVLEKVNAVNEATNKLIGATSKMLKDQGANIQQQAMEASVSVDTLKEAFANTFDALDAVSNYKSKALPQMKNSIEQFRALADEGEKRIQKMEATEEKKRQMLEGGGNPIKKLNS